MEESFHIQPQTQYHLTKGDTVFEVEYGFVVFLPACSRDTLLLPGMETTSKKLRFCTVRGRIWLMAGRALSRSALNGCSTN
ncbi:hypothetical protein Y032_0213g2304 [Ancylostoma ceylanicum]|uniref:Uncharacterized protein n=1 Tax=Ancylostoma ceylanicum TaxID=53326 RepID=A0A016SKI8_9BILA|nr:hypothetical protein Y032_0213g2304 [Ancylostoma ceylanicum]